MRAFVFAAGLILASISRAASESPASVKSLLSAAEAKAQLEEKLLLVHFGASWCSWCSQFDKFLAVPEVRAVIDRYFVEVKLDTLEEGRNRKLENPGAESFLKRLGGGEAIFPFYAFLDPKGKLIVSSKTLGARKTGTQDIGYPGTPERIEWFLATIKKAAPSMSPDALKTIEDQLRRLAAEIAKGQ